MEVRCVKAFGNAKPGDTTEVPDGAAVDPEHWTVVTPTAAPAPAVPPPAAPVTAAGGITLPPPAAASAKKEGA